MEIDKTPLFKEKATKLHKGKYTYDKVKYKNSRTNVLITCPLHGDFLQTPKSHLKGCGCHICANISSKGKYKPFLEKFHKRFGGSFTFPYIETEYENNKSYITVKCARCGNEVKRQPNYLLNPKYDHICNECPHLFSYEELSSLAQGNKLKVYDGLKDKRKDNVTAICEIHGEYKTCISSVLKNKYACKKCVIVHALNYKRVSIDDFTNILKEKYPSISILNPEEYVNTSIKLQFICNVCNHTFTRKPNTFICAKLANPCPVCSKKVIAEKRTKTTKAFIDDAIKRYGTDKFDFTDTIYTKSSEKVEIKCKECGRTFSIEANSFLSRGHGCPYHNCNSSVKEKEISSFLSSLGVNYETNDRTVLNGNELDIYIKSHKIAIEFDGVFWHNELYKSDNYHRDKTDACHAKGIRLIHIFEDEWINKRNIWESMLINILGLTKDKIYARKCTIKEVNSKEASKFLEENHIQGKCGSSIRYGLYHNGELVSLMTFGKTRHFIGNSSHEYELLRFCNRINTSVIGGASKLFKHFIKTHNPINIVSYADRRWSVGNLYKQLGFKLYNVSKPNYFYVINNKRVNRFNLRKSILVEKYGCPEEMSEREFCRSKKLWRIYDCGALCYEWKK